MTVPDHAHDVRSTTEMSYFKDSTGRITPIYPTSQVDSTVIKHIHFRLKGYIESRSNDSLNISFWHIDPATDQFINSTSYINSSDSGNSILYKMNIDFLYSRKFSVPFHANVILASTIPFRYRIGGSDGLDADFLNVGVSALHIWGKTKFFKQDHIKPRFIYWGMGGFVGFSQLKLDSTNTKPHLDTNMGTISYGFNVVGSVQDISILVALGFENAIGTGAGSWTNNSFNGGTHPWIGFGFGFKLIDLGIGGTQADNK
jgi:hypothetical protein